MFKGQIYPNSYLQLKNKSILYPHNEITFIFAEVFKLKK